MNEASKALNNLLQKDTTPPSGILKKIDSGKRDFINNIERKMPDKTQAFFDYDINEFKCASRYFETISLRDKNWAGSRFFNRRFVTHASAQIVDTRS